MRGLRNLLYGAAALLAVLLLLPGRTSGAERSRYLLRLQDSLVRAQDSLGRPVSDSLAAVAPPLDSAAQAAFDDSVRRVRLYDSLDRVFWGQIDTATLPRLDSIYRAYEDSIAQRLPDTSDIKRLIRRLRKEERDSLKAAKPRVMQTYVLPDSLYYRRILVWTSDKKFNEMTTGGLDTTANANFSEYPMYRKDVGASYLGTIGSATQYFNWFKREEVEDAPMFTPYIGDSYTDETIPQYNTKTPYTELAYWGTPFANKKMEESNLHLLTTQNITPAFNFTLAYNRLGSHGMLTREDTDHRTTMIVGNYMGRHYFANFGTIRQRVDHYENGGVRDAFWIRDTSVETKSIEVNLSSAHNLYKRRQWFIHQTLAVSMNFLRKDRDSLELGEGTMAHIGHSGEFTTYNKRYTDALSQSETAGSSFYHDAFYLNASASADELAVRNFENRFFIKLQPYAPDAMLAKINAGVGYQILSTYSFSPTDYLSGRKFKAQHNLYVYGGASGQLKKYLAWDADADYYFAGYRMFDFDINGKLRLSVYPIEDGIHLSGKFHTGLRTPHPFEQTICMNHHRWDNDFSKVSKTTLEAELSIPKWRLDASFGYGLVANMLYYDTTGVIRQYETPVNVMSATLHKDFTLWRFHFDNRALFQLSSASDVLPLPKLALNLRWYVDIDVVKEVMNAQIGINAIANTRWYAPAYSPDIGQFHLQTNEKYGNIPYCDIFVNIQWKRASLFIKYTNAFREVWDRPEYFSAYHYIKPASGIKFGIHWPFYIQ
ncbi:MAG: putative porin [Bacteroidales bacterium]|nr:putative porin [Bacteroidales bacterium]